MALWCQLTKDSLYPPENDKYGYVAMHAEAAELHPDPHPLLPVPDLHSDELWSLLTDSVTRTYT